MNELEYKKIVEKNTPKVKVVKNALWTFFWGGVVGVISEFMLRCYMYFWHLPRKESGVLVILTLIVLASILTAFGIFDILMNFFKSALLIPITGFAHSLTSAALEYKNEGLILGIGTNIFKLAGSVILYGIVAVYVFGLIRLVLMGG